MLKVLLVVAIIAGIAFYLLRPGRGRKDGITYVGHGLLKRDEQSILVEGWSGEDLRTILDAFCVKYGLARGTFETSPEQDGRHRVRASGIAPARFLFLVNYIHYPDGFDLTGRRIVALGQFRLSDATGLPADARTGEQAWAYMPSDDRDYDLAFVRRRTGQTYRISFRDMAWQPVADPRLTPELRSSMAD